MDKVFKLFIIVFLAFMTLGCSLLHRRDDHNKNLSQTRYNVYLLSQRLANYHVAVFQRANSLRMVLPNKDFFIRNSANFTGAAYEALDLIYGLANYYQESSIAVTGYYAGNIEDDCVSKSLAVERARKIMWHLWRSKIDSNFVHASGKKIKALDGKKEHLSDCVLIELTY